jgi:hypothetical protein
MARLRLIQVLFGAGALLMAACGGREVAEERIVVVTEVITEVVEREGQARPAAVRAVAAEVVTEAVTEVVLVELEQGSGEIVAPVGADLLAALEWSGEDALADAPLPIRQPGRLIIKSATMAVTVMETDQALERAVQVAVDYGGYIISQRVWDGSDKYRYATLTLAVPVAQFEAAMRSLRTLGTVSSETAAGQDVTDEFVDLNSRLGNLQATQQRLRTFLDQATTITETLAVHEELRRVEDQIGLIQGRMNYLQDRALYSTISLALNPWIPTPTPSLMPTVTPTPTLTPTPTPTPTATPAVWRPGETAGTAAKQLQRSSQSTADWLIYNGIICGPWLLLLGGLGWLGFRFWRRLERQIDYRAG